MTKTIRPFIASRGWQLAALNTCQKSIDEAYSDEDMADFEAMSLDEADAILAGCDCGVYA